MLQKKEGWGVFCTQGQRSCRMLLCCFLQQMGDVTWTLIIEITPDFEEILPLNNDRIGRVITFALCGTGVFL